MANPFHRYHEDAPDNAPHLRGITTNPSEDAGIGDDEDDNSPSSPIENWEQKQQGTKNNQEWNNPQDNYGSVPYDGTDTYTLLPEYPTIHSSNTTKIPSRGVNAGAIIVPVFILLCLTTGIVWCFTKGGYKCSSSRKSRKPRGVQTLAADLEAAGRPPRVLSPSVQLPASEPREHERGWIFMPQLGVPNWVRGYRRRSDPRGADDPDWQLDVNDVGEAPPEYTIEEKAEIGETLQRSTTNATTQSEMLPGYDDVHDAQGERQDEVHTREADRASKEDNSDVDDARQARDEKNSSSP